MIAGISELQVALDDTKWTHPQRDRFGDAASGEYNLRDEFSAALESPVGEHPPLSQSVFAGDRVAIVLQSDLPQAPEVVDILLRRLMETNIEPPDITVVISLIMASQFGFDPDLRKDEQEAAKPEYENPLDDEFRGVNFLLHDAADEYGVAYIVANEQGLPVKVNRAIVDADVIIPVGCPGPGDHAELVDCIYPGFSNEETQKRYRDRKNSINSRRDEIELANDHLGVFFSIQLVAGAGGRIIDVSFGQRSEAIERAIDESDRAWSIESIDEVEMAIATIETEPSLQTWKDFANALVAANTVANSQGPIVVWSAISQQPKSEIRKTLNEPFESSSRAKLSRLMQQVAGIVAERQVFLKSELSQSVVEELGLGYVSAVSDIERLLKSQNSGVLLRDAHRCQVQLNVENVDAQ